MFIKGQHRLCKWVLNIGYRQNLSSRDEFIVIILNNKNRFEKKQYEMVWEYSMILSLKTTLCKKEKNRDLSIVLTAYDLLIYSRQCSKKSNILVIFFNIGNSHDFGSGDTKRTILTNFGLYCMSYSLSSHDRTFIRIKF